MKNTFDRKNWSRPTAKWTCFRFINRRERKRTRTSRYNFLIKAHFYEWFIESDKWLFVALHFKGYLVLTFWIKAKNTKGRSLRSLIITWKILGKAAINCRCSTWRLPPEKVLGKQGNKWMEMIQKCRRVWPREERINSQPASPNYPRSSFYGWKLSI